MRNRAAHGQGAQFFNNYPSAWSAYIGLKMSSGYNGSYGNFLTQYSGKVASGQTSVSKNGANGVYIDWETNYTYTNGTRQEVRDKDGNLVGIILPEVGVGVVKHSMFVSQGQWGQYPIDNPSISSDYGMRNGEMHNGVDFVIQLKGVVDGKPVYSVSDGKVVRLVTPPDGNRAGVRVRIQAPSGYQYNYFHLQDGSNSHLQFDMTINEGDFIGNVGNTGVSRGAHLHFEIWAPNGTKVNPYDIYPALYNIPHP